jgi:hypothetical protein
LYGLGRFAAQTIQFSDFYPLLSPSFGERRG